MHICMRMYIHGYIVCTLLLGTWWYLMALARAALCTYVYSVSQKKRNILKKNIMQIVAFLLTHTVGIACISSLFVHIPRNKQVLYTHARHLPSAVCCLCRRQYFKCA